MANWKNKPFKVQLPLTSRERAVMELAVQDGRYKNRVGMLRELITAPLADLEKEYGARRVSNKESRLKAALK